MAVGVENIWGNGSPSFSASRAMARSRRLAEKPGAMERASHAEHELDGVGRERCWCLHAPKINGVKGQRVRLRA